METTVLECNVIEFPKVSKAHRSFDKKFAAKLACNIKVEGLWNAIVVRPNPEKPGHYIGVQGRHRHYAVGTILKEQFIDARVIDDMDDDLAEMATHAENLFRNPLTKNQEGVAIKRWWNLYAKKNPELAKAGLRASKARKAKDEAKAGDESAIMANSEGEATEGEAQAEAKAEENFTDQVAAILGTSARTAQRKVSLAKKFDEEQLEVLDQMQVNQEQREALAKIKDKTQRAEVIKLIASGLDPEPAMKEVLKDAAPVVASTAAKEAREKAKAEKEAAKEEARRLKEEARAAKEEAKAAKEAAKAGAATKTEREPELSDDEWFEKYCGDKAKLLADPTRFKVDALLYRDLSDVRHYSRVNGREKVKARRSGKVSGSYTGLANRFINISHPKDWLLCGTCGGKGHVDEKRCPKCYGQGYEVKLEESL